MMMPRQNNIDWFGRLEALRRRGDNSCSTVMMSSDTRFFSIALSIVMVCVSHAAPVMESGTAHAHGDNRTWTRVPNYKINLDLPPKQRWGPIVSRYKDQAPALLAYLESNIPKWAMPIIQTVGTRVRPYFSDYGEEMEGIAEAYGLKAASTDNIALTHPV